MGIRLMVVLFVLSSCSGEVDPTGHGDTVFEVTDRLAADAVRDGEDISRVNDFVEISGQESVTHGGVDVFEQEGVLVLSNQAVELRFDLGSGTYDVLGTTWGNLVAGAEARVIVDDGSFEGASHGTAGRSAASWEASATDDALGSGVDVIVHLPGEDAQPHLHLQLGMRGSNSFVLSRVVAEWPGAAAGSVKVRQMSPLVADPVSGGALFVGEHPWKHVVLDNGSDMYFDFAARVFRVGQGGSLFFPPGSVSNWNMALTDSLSERNLVAAWLSHESGLGLIRLHFQQGDEQLDDGRTAFTHFDAFARYEPPRRLWPDTAVYVAGTRALVGELFYLDLEPKTPFDGLEQWAQRFSAFHETTIWKDIPASWNSWTGGSKSGGMSSNISEKIILENLDLMVKDFAPYGMQYFLIDDGWQKDHGDWESDPEAFPPHGEQVGLHWVADRIRDHGLIPGIWIAPFWVKKSAQLYSDHPDWFVPVNELGEAVLDPDKDAVLDVTHPEVLEYIHQLFTRITQEWGYKWIKMDFAYYTLFTKDLHNPNVTASEAFRNAIRVIRDAIGPDTFFLSVSALGLCMDIADGSRLTLDNAPIWGDGEANSIKTTLLTAAHRYYLSWGWVTHPDLLFFRPEPYGMTVAEGRTWATFVSLYGGIVKLGETFKDMHAHPDWMDIARRLMPVHSRSARPLDLFENLYPETWVLPVERNGRTWHVVGLFNWGENMQVATLEERPEMPAEKTLTWAMLGLEQSQKVLLFDMWEHSCLWTTGPDYATTVDPRRVRIWTVVPESDHPAVVATSRHLLGGAVEVSEEQWVQTEEGYLLSFDLDSPPGFPFVVHATGAGVPEVVDGPLGTVVSQGPCQGVWSIEFGATTPETHIQLLFGPANL